ncbi:unnamed protein product [Brassica oleracea var. botrytis]
MSTKAEIDQVWNQMQQGVRRMRPLVVEQQTERDMRCPKPAMVVQERCSRSSYLERMEKYWTERWIEIALAGGTSMEEIEEIRASTNYDRPVRTFEEERKARLEMLEECCRMIERDDEEDAAKKSLEEETDRGHVEGSLKSFCPLIEPIQLRLERKNDHEVASQETHNGKTFICWDQKVEPYFERGKDARDELLETKKEKCANHVFDQMAEGEKLRLPQHRKKRIKKENHCKSIKKVKRKYEMMQRCERVLKKLRKWMKHKFKQKNQWEWIKQGSVLRKSGKLLAALTRKRAKSKCGRGNLLSSNQTGKHHNIRYKYRNKHKARYKRRLYWVQGVFPV